MTEDPTPYTARKWTKAMLNLRLFSSGKLNLDEEKVGWAEIATVLRRTGDAELLRLLGLGKVTLAKLREDLNAFPAEGEFAREMKVKGRRGVRPIYVRVAQMANAENGARRYLIEIPKDATIDDVIRGR